MITPLLSPAVLHGATPLSTIRYSPDITAVLGAATVTDENVAEDDLGGLVTLVNIGAIPAAAHVSGYHRLANGDQLLSFDTVVALPGGLVAFPGDVVRFDGSAFTLAFAAAANGIPAGVITDAVTALSLNDLFLSFDTTVTVNGITAADEDLVRFQGGVASLFFDGTAAGVDPSLDLDAAHCLDDSGNLLVSFDGSGTVGGVHFDDEDVLEFAPATGTWKLAYDGSAQHGGWPPADLDAVFAVAAQAAGPVPPAFGGDPNQMGSGVYPGSTRVFGVGAAHGKPGDLCIEIYSVGPNGVPDDPPGSVDDISLGPGGTDADGNFVDAADMPGIGVSPALKADDRIFAVDMCEGLRGAVVHVLFPVATLSPSALVLAVLLLVLVAALHLAGRGRGVSSV
jgi:hypothetical protein